MNITGWLHLEDGGDGSAIPHFFGTREEAQKSADDEMEEFKQALGENVIEFKIEVDNNGRIIRSSCNYKDLR
ncbi:hypothetical protein LCGC14_0220080 [marine sediment metagenome]|uniref:Uncharacterized protein n=1 Tax=marine sediment metagenome TaxID=412755 RepID=A0A0F9XGV1_9ZZZZ